MLHPPSREGSTVRLLLQPPARTIGASSALFAFAKRLTQRSVGRCSALNFETRNPHYFSQIEHKMLTISLIGLAESSDLTKTVRLIFVQGSPRDQFMGDISDE